MGFKDVLRSQWWRVGPTISLIVSKGFQMVVPKLGWREAPSALSPVWHPLLGVLATGVNVAGPQHNVSCQPGETFSACCPAAPHPRNVSSAAPRITGWIGSCFGLQHL